MVLSAKGLTQGHSGIQTMKKAPIVSLVMSKAIISVVGEYTEATADLIHKIAHHELNLMKGCCCSPDLEDNIREFIK